MKFLIYFDYCGDYYPGFRYLPIDAKTLSDAIITADQMWDSKKHYIMKIMERTSKVVTPYKAGYKFEEYTAILTKRRTGGWHMNNEENSEQEHKVNKKWLTTDKNCVWFEVV